MNPKLRPHQAGWTEHDGRPVLYLHERMGLSERLVLVPPTLAPLLSLFDGSRDVGALRSAFLLRSGMDLGIEAIEQILGQLDEALLLESPRAAAAYRDALQAYRAAPSRPPALAGKAYPASPTELKQRLDDLVDSSSRYAEQTVASNGSFRGVISPHIDYDRGGSVYARVWREAKHSAQKTELAIIFGTDHSGGFGKLTPTRQSYSTPWGVLPTDTDAVDCLADAMGHEDAYEEELNHRSEHSIELAAVWLHYVLDGMPCPVVPILCGSFHHFVSGYADPASDARIEAVLTALRQATANRRTIVIAAADLAHVGPAFGDPAPFGAPEKAAVSIADKGILEAIEGGSAEEFFGKLRDEGDQRRVCGLPPIYLALRLLGESRGRTLDYAHCPADAEGGSLVSIAGVLLT